ncbi:hypothetical protein [Pseudomonas sp. CFBP13506]|uniref:hypothetical protein n=1 Tax=Pseudomonas sp. CFBP13506 TaxID=2184010 RepID=UPI0010BF7DBE|nr:hypothetical protein [Pseudomonas sp. CFBP13506]
MKNSLAFFDHPRQNRRSNEQHALAQIAIERALSAATEPGRASKYPYFFIRWINQGGVGG